MGYGRKGRGGGNYQEGQGRGWQSQRVTSASGTSSYGMDQARKGPWGGKEQRIEGKGWQHQQQQQEDQQSQERQEHRQVQTAQQVVQEQGRRNIETMHEQQEKQVFDALMDGIAAAHREVLDKTKKNYEDKLNDVWCQVSVIKEMTMQFKDKIKELTSEEAIQRASAKSTASASGATAASWYAMQAETASSVSTAIASSAVEAENAVRDLVERFEAEPDMSDAVAKFTESVRSAFEKYNISASPKQHHVSAGLLQPEKSASASASAASAAAASSSSTAARTSVANDDEIARQLQIEEDEKTAWESLETPLQFEDEGIRDFLDQL